MWRRQWHPTPVLLPGKSHGRRSLVGCSPWEREESDTTERLHFHFSLSCTREGNGNPLQCSCWRIPGTREPGGLPSLGLHRVRHDWSNLAAVGWKNWIVTVWYPKIIWLDSISRRWCDIGENLQVPRSRQAWIWTLSLLFTSDVSLGKFHFSLFVFLFYPSISIYLKLLGDVKWGHEC